MAYTKTPMTSTDQNTQIPLLGNLSRRTPAFTGDTLNTNCMAESLEGESLENVAHVLKRDGISQFTFIPGEEPAGTIVGVYSTHTFAPRLFVATTVRTYEYQYIVGTGWKLLASSALSWSEGSILGWTDYLYDDGSISVIVTDGTKFYQLKTAQLPITVPPVSAFGIGYVPSVVFLDGYVFAAQIGGDIYNSNLNDPFTWSTANVISAESFPDQLVAIARTNQYLVALGRSSIQFFYDNGNATGTPLAVQSTVLNVGMIGGLAQIGESLYFVGREKAGLPAVYRLEGLKIEKVSNLPLDRMLESVGPSTNIHGHFLMLNGHRIYSYSGVEGANSVFGGYFLDVDTKIWGRLTYGNYGADFPMVQSTNCVFVNGQYSSTLFSLTSGSGLPAYLMSFNPNVYQDNGTNFTATFRTAPYNFGSLRLKFGTRLLILCDKATASTTFSIRWSDDDYQTWNVPRTVDVNSKYTQLYSLGSFRRRAWEISYADNFPMRWQSMELDYQIGQA